MRSISEIDCVSTGSFNFQQRKVGRDSNFLTFLIELETPNFVNLVKTFRNYSQVFYWSSIKVV